MTNTAHDGEVLVTEEIVQRGIDAWSRGGVHAALAAVAPDIAAQAKRECADELRALIDPAVSQHYVDRDRLYALAEKWRG